MKSSNNLKNWKDRWLRMLYFQEQVKRFQRRH